METNQLLEFDNNGLSFEDSGHDNGERHWYASDLMTMLGYEKPNFKAINKAMQACSALNIPIHENFISLDRDVNGKKSQDFKLNRFACYLTAMNADNRKPQVAKAQAYFAKIAEALSKYAREVENVERVVIRDEISQHEKMLSGTAKVAGVTDYGLFQNAGYRGMYNMNIGKLRQIKGIPAKKSPLDYMGKTELAANLFRITQTEEKIKKEGLKGQQSLEHAAENVGQKVRQTMIEISGTPPEYLPAVDNITEVKKGLKTTYQGFKQIDYSDKKKK